MTSHPRLNTKEVALTTVFTALYAILGFIKISPIIGLSPQGITAAAIVAPIIGILLGPYIGTLSTFLGGVIGLSLGALSYPSLAAGIPTAFCAGMISTKRRLTSIVTYLALFLLFAFYPTVGPAWLFPLNTWFQIAGLIILVSPLQSVAGENLNSRNNTRLLSGFFLTCLASTLAGQITGSLVFEALNPDATALLGNWQILTFVYPVERTIIALAAMIIGASLMKVLRTDNLLPSAIAFKKADPPQKARSKRLFDDLSIPSRS